MSGRHSAAGTSLNPVGVEEADYVIVNLSLNLSVSKLLTVESR